MKKVLNKSARPIRVPLGGGKILHLGPNKEAQIADKAAELAGVKRLVKDGTIEILGDGERPGGGGNSGNVTEETHGHAKSTFRRGQGER